MAVREPMREQRGGGEYSGRVLPNTLQPRPSVRDLKPKEQLRLLYVTDQLIDPLAAPSRAAREHQAIAAPSVASTIPTADLEAELSARTLALQLLGLS